MKKLKSMRDLTLDELKSKQSELEDQLKKLNFSKATGQLLNTSSYKLMRKDLARVKTFITQNQLTGSSAK